MNLPEGEPPLSEPAKEALGEALGLLLRPIFEHAAHKQFIKIEIFRQKESVAIVGAGND